MSAALSCTRVHRLSPEGPISGKCDSRTLGKAGLTAQEDYVHTRHSSAVAPDMYLHHLDNEMTGMGELTVAQRPWELRGRFIEANGSEDLRILFRERTLVVMQAYDWGGQGLQVGGSLPRLYEDFL